MTTKPLTKRTMTLKQLQSRALSVLRQVRRQFNRMPHEGGLSDNEFLEQVIEPLEIDIRQDRDILKRSNSTSEGKSNALPKRA